VVAAEPFGSFADSLMSNVLPFVLTMTVLVKIVGPFGELSAYV
jgi:hypothetical protein